VIEGHDDHDEAARDVDGEDAFHRIGRYGGGRARTKEFSTESRNFDEWTNCGDD
jgi:hypothetical protein